MTSSVEAEAGRIPQKITKEFSGRMRGVQLLEAMLLTTSVALGNGLKGLEVASTYQPPSPVKLIAVNLDGKPFGYPVECRPSVPCDPEQDPLDPSQTPSDQLPQGSQPA